MASSLKPQRTYATQIILALLGFVGLIGGVTFISQYQPSAPPAESKQTSSRPADPSQALGLIFPESIKKWDTTSENEVEQLSGGHYDFRFENRNAVPVDVGVLSISCKCTGVSLCVLTPEEMKRYLVWASSVPTFECGLGFSGIFHMLTQVAADQQATQGLQSLKLNWRGDLKADHDHRKVATIPPDGAGLVRMNFQGKTQAPGGQRLSVELWTQAHEGSSRMVGREKLEFSVTYVPPLRVMPTTADLEDMNMGDEKSVDFAVWSSTRAQFSLTARERSGDPCFICTCTPMTPNDCRDFADGSEGHVRALSGYRVHVTVKERLSDKVQLDLGPFQRRIVFSSDPGIEDGSVVVSGNVRGDVVVDSPEDDGKIKLGTFPASRGVKKVVRIMALKPEMELMMERVEPETLDYLKVQSPKRVQSGADSKSHWELAVEIPPGSPAGPLPRHSAILLVTPGNPPRHIRIPVLGTAVQ
jgi:hypothetical protein